MDLKDIDLNLLVVFNQLLIERRVSATAEALDLSQPAVSNALRRLRTLFGDELFLRTSRGMEPTPFATQMAESIGYALGANWTKAENLIKPAAWLVFGLIAVGLAVWVARRWTQVRAEYGELDRRRAEDKAEAPASDRQP